MEAVQASAASTAEHFGLDQARCKEVHGLVRLCPLLALEAA